MQQVLNTEVYTDKVYTEKKSNKYTCANNDIEQ